MSIHPTAVIDTKAELDSSVEVGPYAVIDAGVKIGEGTIISAHAHVSGQTTIGKNNLIGSFTCIGFPPQDLKYHDEETQLVIGDNNQIREFSSMHRGTPGGHGVTTIGSNNLFMGYCHVAHDCIVGNHVIMVNNATLGGHVEVGNRATIGGMSGIHQFVRIGEYAYIGGMSGISLDIPPYVIVAGIRNELQIRSINRIGLKRAGFSSEDIRNLNKAFMIIFKTEDLLLQDALAQVMKDFGDCAPVARMVNFFKVSNRNVARLSSDE
ncbi:MAG: acyl-ACP--UDP-N-acetylglucosamine O-acyltransferase [Proteobacteria bacterium]|nr:acyl-ACP--UDP-N-acetylglucosamine O-acyltransferase [Pseudomonadota bacterium]MBU1640319.1 acyl-ACP--UDP-N-acetylglucosamine O-acyltransferase [Pseudomonadota bacterium]